MNFTFGNTSSNTTAPTNSLFGQQTTSASAFGGSGANPGNVFSSSGAPAGTGNSLFGTGSAAPTGTTASFGFSGGNNALSGQSSANTSNLFTGNNSFALNTNATAGNTNALSSGMNAFGTPQMNSGATLGAFGAPSNANNMSMGFASNTGGFGNSSTLGNNSFTGGNAFNSGSTSLFGAKANTAPTNQFSMGGNMAQGFAAKPTGQPGTADATQANAIQREVDPNTFIPKLFNDERDRILGEFNKLQAYWGTGKGFFAANVAPVEFGPHQSTHKFKAIGFSEIKTPTV
jgi:hypothetical protein